MFGRGHISLSFLFLCVCVSVCVCARVMTFWQGQISFAAGAAHVHPHPTTHAGIRAVPPHTASSSAPQHLSYWLFSKWVLAATHCSVTLSPGSCFAGRGPRVMSLICNPWCLVELCIAWAR